LVYPAPVPCDQLGGTRLGAQVGWPILAGVAVALYHALRPGRAGRPCRALVLRLGAFFLLALFMVCSPFDFWRWLPAPFGCVLFPYRLLSFALLWGCLLGALALAASFGGRMRGEHAAACLLLLGLFAGPYLPAHHSTDQVSVAGEVADPD